MPEHPEANQVVQRTRQAQVDSEAWNSEPQTLGDLESRYDNAHHPGRECKHGWKMVPATEKGKQMLSWFLKGSNTSSSWYAQRIHVPKQYILKP